MEFFIDNVPRVQPFTLPHLGYIAFGVIATLLFFVYLKPIRANQGKFESLLKWINTITVFVFYTWSVIFTDSFLETGLPLHVCRIASVVSLYYFWSHDERVIPMMFYLGAFGVVAIAYPSNVHPLYTHLIGYVSQFTHVLIVVTWLYVVFVKHYRPTWKDFQVTAVFWAISLLAIWGFNYLVGQGEYFYIQERTRPFFKTWHDLGWIGFTYGIALVVIFIKTLAVSKLKIDE